MKTSSLVAVIGASSAVFACLTPFEGRGSGGRRVNSTELHARQVDLNAGKIPIGEGDRFNGGAIVPKGLSTISTPDFNTYLNSQEVHSALKGLAREFKDVHLFEAPFKTFENRTVYGLKVGGKKSNPRNNKGYSGLIQGGSHPRERGSTDHPIYFAADLLWAAKEKRGLTYGGVEFTAKEVKTALDVGFVLIPQLNPDGSHWDQTTDSCWRKNRNTASATPGNEDSVGVDLNRNYDVAWDEEEFFAPEFYCEPCVQPDNLLFPGTAPFSEPETRNVRWALDTFSDVSWFADVHSIAGMVLYGSAMDTVQTLDKNMNWRNPAYNDVSGVYPDRPADSVVYKEFMDEKDLGLLARAASRMSDRMQEAGVRDRGGWFDGSKYPAGQLTQLLGANAGGSAIDYTYQRHFVDRKKNKVLAIGLEFGVQPTVFSEEECAFYPTVAQYNTDLAVVSSGLVQFLISAGTL